MWIDTHCHIHTENDSVDLAQDAFRAEVDALICIGTDVISSQKALGLASTIESAIREGASNLPRTYSTIGLHPHDAANKAMIGVEGIAHLASI